MILGLDAVGFESYFRGTLQRYLSGGVGTRRGAAAVPIAALTDAAIHIISLNPLWVIRTFIADSSWGITYLYTKDLTSSTLSHFIWDLVIFVIAPIK